MRMTQQDLVDAKPLADKILELVTGARTPTAVAGVTLALAAVTLGAGCGPLATRKLFGYFWRELEKAEGQEPGKYERDQLRLRLVEALGEQKMLSIVAFASAELAERQRVLDAIIDAMGVL